MLYDSMFKAHRAASIGFAKAADRHGSALGGTAPSHASLLPFCLAMPDDVTPRVAFHVARKQCRWRTGRTKKRPCDDS